MGAAEFGLNGFTGRITTTLPENASRDDRIRELERKVEIAFSEIDNANKQMLDLKSNLERQISDLNRQMSDKTQSLKERFDGLVIGSATQEFIGVILFVLGVAYSTAPIELRFLFTWFWA